MDNFSARQLTIFIVALLIAGALTAWGTTAILHKFVLDDPADPLVKQGGLSAQQKIGIGK